MYYKLHKESQRIYRVQNFVRFARHYPGISLRGASHYGRPNREAVEVSGQTLLRVQQNGLKIGNKIFIFKHE